MESNVVHDKPSTSTIKRDWINYTLADLKSRSTLIANRATGMYFMIKTIF